MIKVCDAFVFFFFNDTATTEIYTLSLHDALPIYARAQGLTAGLRAVRRRAPRHCGAGLLADGLEDRKSTRLNSSHANISYAVFCLKKKKNNDCTAVETRPRTSGPPDRTNIGHNYS